MPTEHLVANLNAVLSSLNQNRPKRNGKFITRVILTSPPSSETLKVDPKDFPFDDYDRQGMVFGKKKAVKNLPALDPETEAKEAAAN